MVEGVVGELWDEVRSEVVGDAGKDVDGVIVASAISGTAFCGLCSKIACKRKNKIKYIKCVLFGKK